MRESMCWFTKGLDSYKQQICYTFGDLHEIILQAALLVLLCIETLTLIASNSVPGLGGIK